MPPPVNMQVPLGRGSDSEFSDDENSPLTKDAYRGSRNSVQETKGWDVFRNPPPTLGSLSETNQKFFETGIKIFKVFLYIMTFAVVLASGVITKGLVLLMTSQLKKEKKLPLCSKFYPYKLQEEKDYIVNIPELENIQWAWIIFFCFAVPEFGTWVRSTRMFLFKSWKVPRPGDFLVIFLFETLHTIGTGLLMYIVLPELNVVKGAMLTNCVAFIPGLFGLMSRTKKETRVGFKVFMDILALVCQLSGFVVWPIIEYGKDPSNWKIWLIPVALFLTSFGWWENYVDRHSKIGFMQYFSRIKERLWKSRYFAYMFISVWKCVVFFVVMVVAVGTNLEKMEAIFYLKEAFGYHPLVVMENRKILIGDTIPDVPTVAPLQEIVFIDNSYNSPVYVFIIQFMCAWACYVFGKFACKICIQGFSFAFPVNLTIPVTISLLVSACGVRFGDDCAFDFMPHYLFWECKNGDILHEFLTKDYAWMWLLWVLSQTWITLHIWTPKAERLASTEKLFVTPMYNSLLIDQSVALNRRRDDSEDVKTTELNLDPGDKENQMTQFYDNISTHTDSSGVVEPSKVRSSDQIVRIYAVATMWHETDDEMMEMLKSILRMDEDQSARRVAQKYLKIVDPDYYEFETQIFFDDAFEVSDDNEDENVVNQFVRIMVNLMDEAASYVHQTNIRIRPPKKFPAPYGGRLIWTLPGKTKIVVHLKDKSKIRHKKRWSQVMYMYYLLGFKLMDQPIDIDRKDVIAENTFLLALDGDIDFTPPAVALLIDLMKKNTNLGAACGRIHPVGSGLMVWYQMFEYAVGHWLQKATEHVIGCVLCSPGCFSLFRGKALMDDSIMAKYTTKSSQARHYVQYDQGEDRWLCTLILQRGYRVEYSAASDAYTHAPEGFGEFYNQRRRWVPSTMANIMDLLQDWRKVIKINDNISMLYISYQVLLLFGTILGPGTIFLMLVGAFNTAFKISNMNSFIINIIPIVLFCIACFVLKSDMQISIAYVLTAVYALVMVVVLVGMILNFTQESWVSPTAIFFVATAGSFIVTGILHPKEFACLPCGIVYYMVVPSMYLLLQIYSCFNLNNVSWGTREVATKMKKKDRQQIEQEKKAAEEAKKNNKKLGMFGFLYREQESKDQGSLECSLAGLFKILCCVQPKPNTEEQQLTSIANSLDILKKRFESIESHMGIAPPTRRRSTMLPRASIRPDGGIAVNLEDIEDEDSDDDSETSGPKEERDDLVNPFWIEDKHLKRGEVDYMPVNEVQFFKDLIEKYLHPLDKNEQEQKKTEVALKELRNKVVFSFSMMNAVFILVIFLLQENKDILHIDWPLGAKTNITFVEESWQVLISREYLELEPIGLIFVIFFALLLVIQFSGMLIHRFGTMSHILASTELSCCNKKAEDVTEDSYIERNAVSIVKEMQKLKGFGDNNGDGTGDDKLGRRKTIHNLDPHNQKKQAVGSLDVAFKKRFFSISAEGAGNENETPLLGNIRRLSTRRDTIKALAERRESVVQERRQSRMIAAARKQPLHHAYMETSYRRSNNVIFNEAYESDSDHFEAPT